MIHIFGDSFSENHWPIFLTEITGIDHVNHAKIGETNEFILKTLIESMGTFKVGDHIIIQTSGQGRINIFERVIYGDEVHNGLYKHHSDRFTKKQCNIIKDWYDTFFLPQKIQEDTTINSIINISNYLSRSQNVILWNLTSLGFEGSKVLNDNVPSSPKVPHSDLWLELSEGGKKGWIEILMERDLTCSDNDPHPSIIGNRFIATEISKRIGDLRFI